MGNQILKSSWKTALKAGGDNLMGRREQQAQGPPPTNQAQISSRQELLELPLLKFHSPECWVKNACPCCIWSNSPSERDGLQLINAIIWKRRYSMENSIERGVVEAVRCYQFPSSNCWKCCHQILSFVLLGSDPAEESLLTQVIPPSQSNLYSMIV